MNKKRQQLVVRVGDDLFDRISELGAEVVDANPQVNLSRSDLVRLILQEGLRNPAVKERVMAGAGDNNRVLDVALEYKRVCEAKGLPHNFDQLLPQIVLRGLPAAVIGEPGWVVPPDTWMKLRKLGGALPVDHPLKAAINAVIPISFSEHVYGVAPFTSVEEVQETITVAGVETSNIRWTNNNPSHWLESVELLWKNCAKPEDHMSLANRLYEKMLSAQDPRSKPSPHRLKTFVHLLDGGEDEQDLIDAAESLQDEGKIDFNGNTGLGGLGVVILKEY